MGSVTEIIAPVKAAFLKELARHGVVGRACEISGLSRSTAYAIKEREAEFAHAWAEALVQAADAVEFEAHRRSVEGVEKLVFQKGAAVIDPRTGKPYVERAYSDNLIIARLKAMKPEQYRERLDIKTEQVGGALEIDPNSFLRLSASEQHALLAILEKLQEPLNAED